MEKTAIRRMIMTVCAVALTGVTMMGQLLWKVEGNGAKGASYLFGTHHIAPVTLTDSIADFGEAIKSVDAVYGEVEQMESMQDPATMQKMAALMMAPADSTMSKLLSPAQLNSVCAMMTEYTGAQIAPQMLDALKPAALSMQIAMMQNMKFFPGFNPAEQIDATILGRAKTLGKAIKGFETIDQQMHMLLGYDLKKQAADLMETVRTKDKADAEAHRLANAYLSRDLGEIEKLFADESTMDAETRARLIDGRNAAWVEVIKEELPKENVMVVVGAGHLIGDNGLINSLRKAGYTVTPCK